jgi:glycosyltransferase involved in cell wall biosynthesis
MINGATGLVVRANDAEALRGGMRRLLADAGLRRAMGERARRFVETNAPPSEEVYGTILNASTADACAVPC